MSNNPSDPQRHLKTAEAARFLGLSDRTLEKHRSYGTGPIYRKIGGRVVYTLEDLQAWSERAARRSTTDPDAQFVSPAKRTPTSEAGSRPQHVDGRK
jgi:predicted DNA-binding transcriptional regulator AlpA